MPVVTLEDDPLPPRIQERINLLTQFLPLYEAAVESKDRQFLLETAEVYYSHKLIPVADELAKRAGITFDPSGRSRQQNVEQRAIEIITKENGKLTPGMLSQRMGGLNMSELRKLVRDLKAKNKIILVHKKWYSIKQASLL